MGLSVSKSARFKTPEKLLFALIAATGFWTILAAQSLIFENPIRSSLLFAIAFLHVLLAAWYCWFVPHRTRWMTLLIAVIAVFSFSQMCHLEYSSHVVRSEDLEIWIQ